MAKKKKSAKSSTRRRSSARRRPHTKRRSNPGSPPQRRKVPWKELLIAGVAGVAALYAGSAIADTDSFKEFTDGDSKKQALTQAAVGIGGGAAVYSLTKSTPAALGVVAGLAGVAGYSYLNDNSSSSAEVTVETDGTTAGLGAMRRRRLGNAAAGAGNRLPPAGSSSLNGGACCGSCASSGQSCPMPDDMAAIYDESAYDRC